ncbi:hypothetical protein CC2G_005545 [Coprinopsis cinerea AmutBmut pab1-1]|nr:hypothetical protein CC2G_005545 [Coprinopsis cinerea AmutBmut pab1-1]
MQHLRNLRQFVKLTGLGSPSFDLVGDAMVSILKLFKHTLGEDGLTGVEPKLYEGEVALDFHARYFTDREAAPQEKHVPFDERVDPRGILETLRGTRLIHGPDNRVEYCIKVIDPDGTTRYEPYDPACIKEGDIVEVTCAFKCVPIKDRRYRFLPALRAVTLLESCVRKESETTREQSRSQCDVIKTLPPARLLKRKSLFLNSTEKKPRSEIHGEPELNMAIDHGPQSTSFKS